METVIDGAGKDLTVNRWLSGRRERREAYPLATASTQANDERHIMKFSVPFIRVKDTLALEKNFSKDALRQLAEAGEVTLIVRLNCERQTWFEDHIDDDFKYQGGLRLMDANALGIFDDPRRDAYGKNSKYFSVHLQTRYEHIYTDRLEYHYLQFKGYFEADPTCLDIDCNRLFVIGYKDESRKKWCIDHPASLMDCLYLSKVDYDKLTGNASSTRNNEAKEVSDQIEIEKMAMIAHVWKEHPEATASQIASYGKNDKMYKWKNKFPSLNTIKKFLAGLKDNQPVK